MQPATPPLLSDEPDVPQRLSRGGSRSNVMQGPPAPLSEEPDVPQRPPPPFGRGGSRGNIHAHESHAPDSHRSKPTLNRAATVQVRNSRSDGNDSQPLGGHASARPALEIETVPGSTPGSSPSRAYSPSQPVPAHADARAGAQQAQTFTTADCAVAGFALCVLLIKANKQLKQLCQNEVLQRVHPGFGVETGYGLHMGWAIEGAIGSSLKIDASYLSPNVNLASRLEAATKQYRVRILVSEQVVSIMSPKVKVSRTLAPRSRAPRTARSWPRGAPGVAHAMRRGTLTRPRVLPAAPCPLVLPCCPFPVPVCTARVGVPAQG
jgi:hypothetical protein